MKTNKYLVAVTLGDTVVALEYSVDLSDLRAIKLKYTKEKGLAGCEFSIIVLPRNEKDSKEPPRKLSRNGKPQNRVLCKDTGEIYKSVTACSMVTGIPEKSIYESVRRGVRAYGHWFDLLPPAEPKSKGNGNEKSE